MAEKLAKASLTVVLLSDASAIFKRRDTAPVIRLLRIGALLGLMKLTSKLKAFKEVAVFLSVFGAQILLRCFTWNVSLYVFIRLALNKLNSNSKALFLFSASGVFLSNVIHNYLMTHEAETIDPSYISMWLTTLKHYQDNGLQKWLQEFSSKETSSKTYKPDQVSKERLERIPGWIRASFWLQFPFVISLYGIGFLLSLRAIKSKPFPEAMGLIRSGLSTVVEKTMRTCAVLAMLPYVLTEFPVVYAHFILPLFGKRPEDGVKRNPFLHVLLASIGSTLAFLQEPKGRLNMMVGYTWWKVSEALLRKFVFGTEEKSSVTQNGRRISKAQQSLEIPPLSSENVVSAALISSSALLCL